MTENSGYGGRPLWQWIVLYVIVGGVIYAGIYWYFWGRKGYGYSMPKGENTTGMSWTIKLDAQNSSGESGEAIISEEGSKLRVKLNLTGVPTGTNQPAHIHMGSCPNPGTVKYPLSTIAETVIDTTWAELKSASMAINVHKSAAESGIYVSCGNI